MKKLIALSAVLALVTVSVAEARGGRSAGRSYSAKPRTTLPAKSTTQNTQKQQTNQTQSQNKQADATFANTPPQGAMANQARAAAPAGGGMSNFVTGALAGYVLSNALSPSEAQANEANPAAAAAGTPAADPVKNLTEQVAQTAPTAQTVPAAAPSFKSIGGVIEPNLIEKTETYRRYCINGVQYISGAVASTNPPMPMIGPNGQPVGCQISE